jgi:hypothetical protein
MKRRRAEECFMANTDDCGKQDVKRGAKSERDTKGVNKKVE